MKLNFETNIAEGTPEELVDYLRLVEEGEKKSGNELFSFGHAHQLDGDKLKSLVGSLVKVSDSYTDSTELQVGDKVKVLVSEGGAEGEATVTAVLENGKVELEGKNRNGRYLTNWVNHVSNLEKIEEEDELLGYRYWYLEGVNINSFYVLKATTNYFEDSKGKRYTYQDVSGHVKPIDKDDVSKRFKRAKDNDKLLRYYPTVDLFTHEKLQ